MNKSDWDLVIGFFFIPCAICYLLSLILIVPSMGDGCYSFLFLIEFVSIRWLFSQKVDFSNHRIKRLNSSLSKLNKSEDKRRLAAMERFWIQDTPKIHALNYWYYRYFTNEFELFILDAIRFEEVKE